MLKTDVSVQAAQSRETRIKQKIAFHLLFSHDMTNIENVPSYINASHGTLEIIALMCQHKDCTHTTQEIYGDLFSPEEESNIK